MADKITTLHPKNDLTTDLYPNIKADNIPSNAIDSSKIDDGSIINSKIGAGAVTSTKIGDGAVTTTKIASDSISNAKIKANAIDTTNIIDKAVTKAKLSTQLQTIIDELNQNYFNTDSLDELLSAFNLYGLNITKTWDNDYERWNFTIENKTFLNSQVIDSISSAYLDLTNFKIVKNGDLFHVHCEITNTGATSISLTQFLRFKIDFRPVYLCQFKIYVNDSPFDCDFDTNGYFTSSTSIGASEKLIFDFTYFGG